MTKFSSAASLSTLAALVALLLPACIVRGGQPLALYPNPESPRPPAEVARLFGPIAAIDGQDVSRQGKSFALLPGCHIVRLVESALVHGVALCVVLTAQPARLGRLGRRLLELSELRIELDA
jgi:hypothetical protein